MPIQFAAVRCLVTAIGSMSAEAVLTSVRRREVARLVGCNSNPKQWTPTATLVDACYLVPHATDAIPFRQQLLELCRRERITHVLVLTDPEIDTLFPIASQFEEIGTTLCIPPSHAIRICRDKLLLHETFVGDSAVSVIPTWRGDRIHADVPLPWISKPRAGRSSQGICILNDAADVTHHTSRRGAATRVLQPLLQGEVLVVDVVRNRRTGSITGVARRELVRTSHGAGLAAQIMPGHSLVATAARVARRIDLHGCMNVEFLASDRAAYLMDVNPRPSAGVGFSSLAGYDVAANHLRCFLGEGDIDMPADVAGGVYAFRYTAGPIDVE